MFLKGIYSHYYEKLFIAYEKPEKAIRFMNKHIKDKDCYKLRTILGKGKGCAPRYGSLRRH